MVYVEYNTSKKQYVESTIDNIIESESHDGYELLPFVETKVLVPSSNTFALDGLHNEESGEYISKFTPVKTYPYGKYYLEVEGHFYLFEAAIRYGTTLYFDMNGYIDEQDQTHFEPSILVKGYFQSKEILPVFGELELNKSGSETTFSVRSSDFCTGSCASV